MKIGDIDPADRRFWPDEPELGFSPERNKAVVDKTIQDYDRRQFEKRRESFEGIGERSHAVASWLTSQHGAKVDKSFEKYFGKRYLAQLRGEEIIEEMRRKFKMIVNPWQAVELGRRIITKDGVHEVYGSQIKERNKKGSKKTVVV